VLSERERSGTLVDRERENARSVRDVGLYGTGIIFEEPNSTQREQRKQKRGGGATWPHPM
jgi:hypothetical protein